MTDNWLDCFVSASCWCASALAAATWGDVQTPVLLAVGATFGIVLRRLNAWALRAR